MNQMPTGPQDLYESDACDERKRARVISPYGDLNGAMYEWFCSLRANSVPASGPLICNKAL